MNEEMFNLCRAGEGGAKIAVGDNGEFMDLAEYAASIAHEFGDGCAPTRDDMFDGDYCMGCNSCPAGILNMLGSVFVIQREVLRRFEDIVSNEHSEYHFQEIEKALEAWRKGNTAIEQLRGKCWACTHAKEIEIGHKSLRTCEYMDQRGVVGCSGNGTCEHWEWNGEQEK